MAESKAMAVDVTDEVFDDIMQGLKDIINDYPLIINHLHQSELAESQKEQKELKRFEESYYGKVIRNEPE